MFPIRRNSMSVFHRFCKNFILEVTSVDCVNHENRITELQPVEVTVGASGAVHSIQPAIKMTKDSRPSSRDSNSYSPTVLHPVLEPGTCN